ncbi:tRNA (adenosine(37)-N6)-threonylcarbamoyltransferase complex dimerization subunit type 1 TsaB [Streptomyces sp. N2-109]|uniref:tRNA (Adenosine(37)-N6)-threonylcarbamoyltransferase complex dimerization subunit type 1 TsaB n=1 Tax=Streptomyces gossypii TaxID=2883101 RepID=A0ABT2JWL7_9ACTN|nr:tRNA (adenosine(37)-N6)-threonylcarbamoyltransferase complex dimerization subunit type 1 TsaB [Streptomyces gossypii]MCT2592298.1 tRNA (adenosine(37)-N6)-threonylcarbamoyltransferase complex dimerization subunit type 1 TsaB [Streptomyces gossypii]
MLLLALDTATPTVAVALHDGDRVLAQSHQTDARRHGELLLPAVDKVLRMADRALPEVTGIVVGVGPGPYTGLRVGLATAAAFSAALGTPVHGLCTLDGLAYASGLDIPFVVATDARRKEVYWARYADARTRIGEPAVDRPAELAEAVAGLPAVGAGALLYPDTFTGARAGLPAHQSAAALAELAVERLAAGAEFLPPLPLYLRRPDAQVPANYKVVTPRGAP